MGFNMSGSEVGRGECLQPRGSGPGHAPREKSCNLTRVFLTN